jgi:hypothetical protein
MIDKETNQFLLTYEGSVGKKKIYTHTLIEPVVVANVEKNQLSMINLAYSL